MRGAMLEVPRSMLDERRQLGIDGRDEMWSGVVHMVPPVGGPHQGLNTRFLMVVGPLAEQRGLVPHTETGLFRSDADYRVPDQLYARAEQLSERGVEGAEVVAEVRSPRDETYEKFDFYIALGVREVLVLHPGDRRAELFRLIEDRLLPVSTSGGVAESEVLGIGLSTVEGKLRITWSDGSADI
ncbi:MAG: Uma2 family endonuclease [Pseudonocardia sp.]|uniref:Uma2 family endonuclease n=1 Tax=Pseudonocardia sp. TaxID=60912 RepID=UPI001AD29A7E|nr:Uma2 family endonuclease [Pseudonocardia sp.]MBN9101811.1 Uma2 family endonuclease [Pseudonocardia sp.]